MLLRGPTFADRLGASSKRGGVNGVGTPHPDPPLPLIRLRRFASSPPSPTGGEGIPLDSIPSIVLIVNHPAP